MSYEALRHFADSYVLAALGIAYLILCGWAFVPGARAKNEHAANIIFKDDDHG